VSNYVYMCIIIRRVYYHTLPRALPHTATHCCTLPRALPHTAVLPHTHNRTSAHYLPHCRTDTAALPHVAALPHTAALPHSATLPCALSCTTVHTAAHCCRRGQAATRYECTATSHHCFERRGPGGGCEAFISVSPRTLP
jgi:hypothetical protein